MRRESKGSGARYRAGVRGIVRSGKLDFSAYSRPPHWLQRKAAALHERGPRPIGEIAAEIAANVQFRRNARLLHRKGERMLGEFLAHIVADRALATYLESEVDRFLTIPDPAFDATGGRAFSSDPLSAIDGGRE